MLMLKKLFSSQLRINMASGVVVTVINAVTMVVAYPVHLHFLGYEKYGVWLILATVLAFAHLGNLGVTSAVTKFVAEEVGKKNMPQVERYLFNATVILFVTGAMILMLVVFFKTQIAALFRLTGENETLAIKLLPYIGILTIYCLFTHVLNAALIGLGRQDITNYIQSVARILILVTAVVLYSFGRGIESLVVGYSLSYLLIHIVSVIYIRKIADIHFIKFKYLDTKCMKTLLGFGGKVVTGQLLQIFISPFNKLMLSRYIGVHVIPVYEIAYGAVILTGCFLETGFRALMPEISRLNGMMTPEARARIAAIYGKALKLVLIAALPGYFILFLAAPMIFRLWLRDSFNEQIPYAFQVMLVGGFLFLLAQPANNMLMGIGKVNHCLVARCIQTAANIIIVIAVVAVSPLTLSTNIAYAVAGSMALWACYLLVTSQLTFNKVLERTQYDRDNICGGIPNA